MFVTIFELENPAYG